MRHVPSTMWAIWRSGNYVGDDRRPMTRVTIQIPTVFGVTTSKSRWKHLFNQPSRPKELPNLKSCEIDRSLDQDAATCTMVFYNTAPLAIGTLPRTADLDQPGYYTYNHGISKFSARWKHTANEWKNYLVPDRIIRTYQGYGFDVDSIPEEDSHLVQTGEWHIDKVTMNSPGTEITVTCRDRAGPGLIDQINFPPVIPQHDYPLWFKSKHKVTVHPSAKWKRVSMRWDDDSNTPWVGHGAAIYGGHNGVDAFDDSSASYWLSIGNSGPGPSPATWAFEWIQGKCSKTDLDAVEFTPVYGNHVVYVSVYVSGSGWQGSSTIPYDPAGVGAPNGADIKYVKKTTCATGSTRIELDRTYHNVTRVRITFTNLANSNLGPYHYRAGVRTFHALKQVQPADKSHYEGNYSDYSQIVKWLLCWGGFFWPDNSKVRLSDNSQVTVDWSKRDPDVDGRVWGDILMSGTAGLVGVDLTPDIWDKKPLMDGINYVKDILGFIFWVDEEGAAVFRLPNIYQVGNYMQTLSSDRPAYTKKYTPVIDERVTLVDLASVLDKENTRSLILVANSTGNVGALVDGQEPFPVGWKRMSIWTDSEQNFANDKECQVMAELMAVRYKMTFRTDNITIAGLPAFQIDDQVRIFERVTSEGYIHYVNGITSNWAADTGEYTMTMQTQWLGDNPKGNWFMDQYSLSKDTVAYLKALGRVDGNFGER